MAVTSHLEFEKDIVEIQGQIQKLLEMAENKGIDVSDDLQHLRRKLETLMEETYENLSPMEQVQVARHPRRPYALDYIERIFSERREP